MQQIRVGFIGAGWINEIHARALKKCPGVELAAVYNHRPARAEAFNAKHLGGGAEVFSDCRKMIDTAKLDAIYVALPPGAHDGEVEYAASKGVHLLLEKPIALSMERAESIASAVRAAGVVCTIGHHLRHSAPVRKLKEALLDGSAGRPLMMQGRWFANSMFPAWWRDPQLGGGQLIEQAIHLYDLARYFFGPADRVSGFADRLFHDRFADYKVDDVSAATVRFKNSAIASICAVNCAEPHDNSVDFTVLCEKVAVTFTNPKTATFAFHGGKKGEEVTKEAVVHETVTTDYDVYETQSDEFLLAVRTGTPVRSTIDDGVESLRLVLAAAKSARDGGAVQEL